MSQSVNWGGYEFQVLQYNGTWNDVPGIYIFAGPKSGWWSAIYVGQTGSFSDRFSSHERWLDAVKMGCTVVHARVEWHLTERFRIEEYLIRLFQPPLNNQL